jgi:hypothetical protein
LVTDIERVPEPGAPRADVEDDPITSAVASVKVVATASAARCPLRKTVNFSSPCV